MDGMKGDHQGSAPSPQNSHVQLVCPDPDVHGASIDQLQDHKSFMPSHKGAVVLDD